MSYKVIKDFTDLQDNNHIYRAGDKFPRDGADVTQGRIDELASRKNGRKEALIEEERKIPEPTEAEFAAEPTNPESHEATEVEETGEETGPEAEKSEVKKPKDKKPHKTEGKRNKNA